jgi:tetratricopeptide (TPR) repeat protein
LVAKRTLGLLLICSFLLQAAEPESVRKAEKELFAARYVRAAHLYTKLLHDDPGWAAGYYGLVRSLIGAYRAPEAYAAAEDALRRAPDQAESQAAAGMAAYRHGDIAQAELYFKHALKINPACAAAMSGLARIYANISRFKAARTLTNAAYEASNDPNLITAWANTLEGQEHIAALERALAIYDPSSRDARSLRAHIASDKVTADRKLRRLTTPYQNYEVKLRQIMDGPNRRIGVGFNVQFNGQRTFRLLLDTAASGISVSPKAGIG